MNDTLSTASHQLVATQRVLDEALARHGFDFGVFISVRVRARRRLQGRVRAVRRRPARSVRAQ